MPLDARCETRGLVSQVTDNSSIDKAFGLQHDRGYEHGAKYRSERTELPPVEALARTAAYREMQRVARVRKRQSQAPHPHRIVGFFLTSEN